MNLEELYRLLRSSHVQSQGIVDTLRAPLVVLDRGFTVVNANPAFYNSFQTDRESTLGQSLFDLGDGQWNIAELRTLLSDVLPNSSAVIGYQVEHDFTDVGQRTVLVSARRLVHPDNSAVHMLVVFEDVTERERADKAKDFLVAETRHRMKNLMAVIRAVAHQTDAKGRSGEEYREVFMGRFESAMRAQEIMNFDDGRTDLQSLVTRSLEPIGGAKFDIAAGPSVDVEAHQVTPISMILHELATNALKYGALSAEAGIVHVSWSARQQDDRIHLQVHWREEGGPAVVPPTRKGFGTRLIEYSAQADGGSAEVEFNPAGIRVQLNLLVKP